jgi:hypothetical protein
VNRIKINYLLVKLSIGKSSCLRTTLIVLFSQQSLGGISLVTSFSSLLFIKVLFGLVRAELVTVLVFHIHISISFVFDEHALNLCPIILSDFVESNSLIVLPIAIVDVSVEIVVLTIRVAHVVLHVTFIELSVGKEDLHLTICNFPVFKTAFDNFISRSEKPSESMRSIFFPGTTVNATVRKFAETGSFTLVSFEVSFVDLSISEKHLALTIAQALADSTFVDIVFYIS